LLQTAPLAIKFSTNFCQQGFKQGNLDTPSQAHAYRQSDKVTVLTSANYTNDVTFLNEAF